VPNEQKGDLMSTIDKAYSYDAEILEKLIENGRKVRLKMIATELSDHSIKLTVFVADEVIKNNLRNALHVEPMLPPVENIK
jgi:hypothetical protein